MDDLFNSQLNAHVDSYLNTPINGQAATQGLMTVEAVQKALNRSRASVYRYANTNPSDLNPSYDPRKLNPELRVNKDDPLLFHPNEVARFAQDVLGIKQVTIEVQQPSETVTHDLLRAILSELQSLKAALNDRSSV